MDSVIIKSGNCVEADGQYYQKYFFTETAQSVQYAKTVHIKHVFVVSHGSKSIWNNTEII